MQNINYLISPELDNLNNFFPKLRIAVLASGEGSNFQRLIDLSSNKKLDIEIPILITNQPHAGCISKAEKNNIPCKVIDNQKYNNKYDFESEIISTLKDSDVELVVMAGWMRVVSSRFVNKFKSRIINIHPSLLPSFKGKNAVGDAIRKGSLITGCSVHYVEEEVDSGQIIIQSALPIEKNDDERSLLKKIHFLEHLILPYAISIAGKQIRDQSKGKN